MKKNPIIKSIALFITLVLTIVAVPGSLFAWYTRVGSAGADSSEIGTTKHGYGGKFQYDNSISYGQTVDENDESYSTIIVKPGDVVYYTFYFDVEEDKMPTDRVFHIQLVLSGSASDDATASTGDYQSFLANTTIEADSCSMAVMEKTKDEEEDVFTYNPVTYAADGTLTDETADSNITVFSGTTSLPFSNTEVPAIYADSTIAASFSLTFPNLSEYPVYEETINEDTNHLVYFQVIVPIWYKDTGANQNMEMDSVLEISNIVIN